jgi:hypothetical protein
MSTARTISLCAWAAVIAAWALPQNGTVQKSSDFTQAENLESSSTSTKIYGPGALPFAMEPADLWAIATIRIKQLPPVKYDHPTKVPVEIHDLDSEESLREECGFQNLHTDRTIIGCADPKSDRCDIYLGPIPASTGITRNINIRHEIGHCNGWSGDHAGMR